MMMANEEDTKQSNALVMIFLRQAFYLQQLRLALGAVLLNLVLIAVLLGMLVYFVKHPVHPIYFATDNVGHLMVEPPVSQPNMNLPDVMNWAAHAVEQAYTYDFMNYREQFQAAQKYFTDFGWRQYMKGLQASNNLLALDEHKMIVVAKVVAQPQVLIQGILGSRYAYKFQMPMLVTYYEPPYDEKTKFSNPLVVTVIVERQKLSESDNGLGIVQLIAGLAIGNQQQQMNSQGG